MNRSITRIFTTALVLFMASCNNNVERNAMKRLEDTIKKKGEYEQAFLDNIDRLKSELHSSSDNECRWEKARMLHGEYLNYDIDSALVYSNMMISYADSPEKETIAAGAQVSCLCALRLYTSAERLLSGSDTTGFNDVQKYAYYKAYIALYTALGNEFGADEQTARQHLRNRHDYQGKLIGLHSLSNDERKYMQAKQLMLEEKFDEALVILHDVLEMNQDISARLHTTYAIANCYKAKGERSNYKRWLAETAIYDFKRPNRQYRSLYDLALCLYEDGKHRKAGAFIQTTVIDAIACKHDTRIINAIEAQMIITAAMEENIKRERAFLSIFICLMILAIMVVSAALAKVNRQRRRLKTLMLQIKESNTELSKMNGMILESNLIKEKYMFKYMYLSANFIKEMDEYRKNLRLTYKEEGTDALISKLREPEYMYLQYKSFYRLFDEIFLGIFPDFPEKVNNLMKEDKQIGMKQNGTMPTELRILAVIRLGITESRKIAEFLNTSVNTIYTYRTKMRYDSISGPELFEELIKQIDYYKI